LQTPDPNASPFDPVSGPAHPIISEFANPNVWLFLQVFFVASVVAPIVEETMFRGVLYRHLREATGWTGTFLSVVFSGTVASFIFAVIHPQGIVAVPALMALAYGFTIAREWRGSLIAPMVAHGINNGVLMTFVMVALGN
jgi:membrane protease YdiL (CAAX protease family)